MKPPIKVDPDMPPIGVSLYLLDGTKMLFGNARACQVRNDGSLTIQLQGGDAAEYGTILTTNLPYLIIEK